MSLLYWPGRDLSTADRGEFFEDLHNVLGELGMTECEEIYAIWSFLSHIVHRLFVHEYGIMYDDLTGTVRLPSFPLLTTLINLIA